MYSKCFISDDPDYKPLVFYAQGFIDEHTRKCTIMSPQSCLMQPTFSNPSLKYEGEVYGVTHIQDNAGWIKQNRFVLQLVGNQQDQCPQGMWLAYVPWLLKCLTVDVTKNNTWGLLWCKEENIGNMDFMFNKDQ